MNFAAWLPIFMVILAFTGVILVHLATHDVVYMPKWAWAGFVVVTMPLGGVVYLAIEASRRDRQRPEPDGPGSQG